MDEEVMMFALTTDPGAWTFGFALIFGCWFMLWSPQ